MTTRLVGVNEGGRRVGDYHPNAKLSDGDVELLLEMHSEGWGYKLLAQKFEITPSAVRHICKGRNRCQRVERFKRVDLNAAPAPKKPRGRPRAAPLLAAGHLSRTWAS